MFLGACRDVGLVLGVGWGLLSTPPTLNKYYKSILMPQNIPYQFHSLIPHNPRPTYIRTGSQPRFFNKTYSPPSSPPLRIISFTTRSNFTFNQNLRGDPAQTGGGVFPKTATSPNYVIVTKSLLRKYSESFKEESIIITEH